MFLTFHMRLGKASAAKAHCLIFCFHSPSVFREGEGSPRCFCRADGNKSKWTGAQFLRNMLAPSRADEMEEQQSVCRHYSRPAGPKGPEVNFCVRRSPPWALYPLCFWGLLRKRKLTQNHAVWPLRPKEMNNWFHSSPSTVLLRRRACKAKPEKCLKCKILLFDCMT